LGEGAVAGLQDALVPDDLPVNFHEGVDHHGDLPLVRERQPLVPVLRAEVGFVFSYGSVDVWHRGLLGGPGQSTAAGVSQRSTAATNRRRGPSGGWFRDSGTVWQGGLFGGWGVTRPRRAPRGDPPPLLLAGGDRNVTDGRSLSIRGRRGPARFHAAEASHPDP